MSAARRFSVCVAAAVLVCGASPAAALPPLLVEVGYGDQVATSRTFDLVSTQDHLSGFQLSVATRLLERWPRVWVEVSEFYGGTSADLHGIGSAALAFHEVGASALYRRTLVGPLGWYAKAGPRLAIGQLSIEDASGNGQLGQWNTTVGLGGAAGLEAALRLGQHDAGEGTTLGLRLEAGYIWFPDLSFNALQVPKPTTTTPGPSLVTSNVAVGSLNLSGIHWGLTAFAKF